MIDAISVALNLATGLVDRIWPDPAKAAEEKRKLIQMAQDGRLDEIRMKTSLMLAQIEVNLEQAKHPSLWVSGARPAAIWGGVLSLSWAGLFHPMLTWIVS